MRWGDLTMSGVSTRRRARTVAALAVLAMVPATGTAPAADKDENAPPVVTIRLDEGEPKITGADKLSAGWVTIKVSAKKSEHNLWLYTPKPGVHAEDADMAGKGVRAARTGNGRSAAATAENSLIALGGAFVGPKRPATMAVKLPQGEVTVTDLATDPQKVGTPLTLLKLGAPGKAEPDAGAAARVSIDDAARIQAPATLPRTGELRIANLAERKWHFLGLQRLTERADQKDVEGFFTGGGKGKSPFDPAHSTAAAPLSGGREQYLSYDLPAGRYAFVDAWVDSATGKFYAAQGAVRVVTLK